MTLAIGKNYPVAPDVVWRLITDTRTWPLWGPSVRAVDSDDVFIQCGSKGRVLTPLGIGLPFVVDAFEPKTYWGWRVAGIPATGHRVAPITPHGCRLTFSVPAWAVAYLPVCYLALVRIQRLLS